MGHIRQQWCELAPSPFVAACSQRTQSIPVIALLACDQACAFGLPGFQMALPGQFDRGLCCLRSARDEVDAVESGRCPGDQAISKRLGRF